MAPLCPRFAALQHAAAHSLSRGGGRQAVDHRGPTRCRADVGNRFGGAFAGHGQIFLSCLDADGNTVNDFSSDFPSGAPSSPPATAVRSAVG